MEIITHPLRGGASLDRHAIFLPMGFGLLALFLSCVSGPSWARDDTPSELVERQNPTTLEPDRVRYFTRQFKAKCARCHGIDGAGGGAEAVEQEVAPADFTNVAYMASRTDGQLFHQILVGGGDRCAMPAFGPGSAHAWNEEKIWQMVAFVRRFAQPPES